jgi:CRISPR/Cas system-associated exonuclease Cas4 (RecB family)
MVYKLSPSAVNLFLECPRCFWLDKHNVWKRPQGIFPSLPSGMDKILKVHFENFREKGLLPPEICENGYCNGMKLFGETIKEKELLKEWQSNFKGIKYIDEKGNLWHGAIDNLLKKDDKLIVLDYKTRGFPLKEDTHEHYQFQMDTYNFLLRKNGYKTEDYTFLLFYIPSEVTETGEVIFDSILKKIPTNPKNAEKIFLQAIKCLDDECPQKTCQWCEKV